MEKKAALDRSTYEIPEDILKKYPDKLNILTEPTIYFKGIVNKKTILKFWEVKDSILIGYKDLKGVYFLNHCSDLFTYLQDSEGRDILAIKDFDKVCKYERDR